MELTTKEEKTPQFYLEAQTENLVQFLKCIWPDIMSLIRMIFKFLVL